MDIQTGLDERCDPWSLLDIHFVELESASDGYSDGQYRCALLRFVLDLVDAPGNPVQAARKLAVGCDRLLG